MSIVSPLFLFFMLPACLMLFYAVGRRWSEAGALTVIFIASLFFAYSQEGYFFAFFAVSLLFNFLTVKVLLDANRHRFAILLGAVAVNVAALSLFKYSGLLDRVGFAEFGFRQLEALIPMSVSFLTFQRMTSLVDAPANKANLEKGIGALRYGAYASFLPNLLIGPIAYLQEILPQFKRPDFGTIRYVNIAVGLTLIAIGLFKKAFVADQIGAAFVDPVWVAVIDGVEVSNIDAFFAMLAYGPQLYFDFSGYSDIAIGIARLFGIILPTNFYSPLRAVGIIDFYRRWHIGLTRVIARFLYSPLSIAGTRFSMRRKWRGMHAKAISLWLPLVVNFLVIGLWHGAKTTFLVFGLIHGIWYAIESEIRSSKRWKNFRKSSSETLRAALGRTITLPLMMLCFSLFRAPNLGRFEELLASLAGFRKVDGFAVLSPGLVEFAVLALAIIVIFTLPNSHEFLRRYRPGIVTYVVPSYTPARLARLWRPTAYWALLMMALACIGLYALPKAAPFSYGVF